MQSRGLETPVVLLAFNRPETTERVLAQIALAKPRTLLVVADGPRNGHPNDADRCMAVRALVDRIDWPCDLRKNYADNNLGCGRRVASGLDWAFGLVEEAIVLEDDCLPAPSFFQYCDELLDRYRDDERVMHIAGANFQFGARFGDASYYFSRYTHVWGWASWRRAWKYYESGMDSWRAAQDRGHYLNRFPDRGERGFWAHIWDAVSTGKIDTWDYQWLFACSSHDGLAITPNVNLVSNIGFAADATHTSGASRLANIPAQDMVFPLSHPTRFAPDPEADRRTRRLFFSRPGAIRRLIAKTRRYTRSWLGRR